jgi:acyl-lipid omega-6 desaturase (Delta-12 desaturase)
LERNESPAPPTETVVDARAWTRVLASYRGPSDGRSIVEIGITVIPLVLLWLLTWATLDLGYWLSILLAVPTAGFLLRLFMIQHDCSHGSFFSHRLANDWIGRVIGVVTMTPYDLWRRTHAIHHATSGNLDRRGFGDVDTLTVQEYRALSRWGRLRYRHPLVMFGLGPVYVSSGRTDAQGLAALGQHHGHKCRHRRDDRDAELVHRPQGIPAGASADHADRRLDRGLAVLRAAPVRADVLGQ